MYIGNNMTIVYSYLNSIDPARSFKANLGCLSICLATSIYAH